MKGLLLRVGIDKGCGGCLSPFFKNGKFEFIPIPEDKETSETKTYANMKGRTGCQIGDFVPKRIRCRHPHIDPEFDTFTYGDPTKIKRCQISQLDPDDLLIFYAGLQPEKSKTKPRLFVVGYFNVERVYNFDFKKIPLRQHNSALKNLENNAHAKRYFKTKKYDKNLVIVKGNAKRSKLLSKPLLLGNHKNYMLTRLEPIFGYKGSLQRAVGHWIDKEHIAQVRKWLRTKGNLSSG
jgi:hypothetical protein